MADPLVEGGAVVTGLGLRSRLAARAERALALSPSAQAGIAVAAALGAVLLVHLPVLGHYFFGDDFVPLADITSRSTWGYLRDLLLVRDLTPNWRFLPGLFYLGAYRAFGLNPFPFFLAIVAVHLGTVGLVFWLVRRATGSLWPAYLAASFFGLTPAHAPTVGQVTALNNVLAGFFLMLALVTLYEGLVRRQLGWWGTAAAVSFAGAIAANESIAVTAPVLALVVLWKFSEQGGWWREPRQWVRLALLSAPYLLIGGVALTVLGACRCTEAAGTFDAGAPPFIENFWAYLGRLLYPRGIGLPGFVSTAHLASAVAVVFLSLVALLHGPGLARISVVFLYLAIVPYLLVIFALAQRYVYVAAIPFSILEALLFVEAARYGRALLAPAAPAVLAIVAFAFIGVYGWQTWGQNKVFSSASDDWRTLVTGMQERYAELPEGSRVYIRGGPLTDAIWQFYVLPSVGEVLYGGVIVVAVPERESTFCIPPGTAGYVVDYDGGRFTPVWEVAPASKEPPPPGFAIGCPAFTWEP